MKVPQISKKPLFSDPGAIGTTYSLIVVGLTLTQTASAALQVSFADLHPNGASASQLAALTESQQVGYATLGGANHAGLWSGTAASFVDLRPGTEASLVNAVNGSQQGGAVYFSSMPYHAALWSGIPGSYVDLNPAEITQGSRVDGMSESQQVGFVTVGSALHAALWSGTPESFIDLNPAGAKGSKATASNGFQQAGGVTLAGSGGSHAALWSGTPESFIDLNPAGTNYSVANALSDTQQVGAVGPDALTTHAALWTGTADSFIDLHPAAATYSVAYAVHSGQQAGYAGIGGASHATLWCGTPDSFTDLHLALGSGYSTSLAKAILVNGNTTYVAGYAKTGGNNHAILWTIRTSVTPPSIAVTTQQKVGSANVLTLTWPNNAVPCVLESAGTLTGGWSLVSSILTTNNGWISTRATNTASQQFYRLRAN